MSHLTPVIFLTPLTNNIILGFFGCLIAFGILGIIAMESHKKHDKKDSS